MVNTVKKFKMPIIIFSLIIAFVAAFYFYKDQQVTYSVIDADHKIYSTPEELINDSDLIVVGTPIGSENYVTKTPEGYTDKAYTITSFLIKNIKNKKNKASTLSNGDSITVLEPTYLYDRGVTPGKIKFAIEGYSQMEPGVEYILFLRSNAQGDKYVINGINQGKYNSDGKDNKEEVSLEDPQKFKEFKNYFKQKYK